MRHGGIQVAHRCNIGEDSLRAPSCDHHAAISVPTRLNVRPMHRPLMTRAGLGPSWLGRHRTRLWDTLRMTAAAAVAFVLGVTLDLSQSFWAVIAAVVATQGSLGGTLKASFEQFIGSVFGAVWGGAITILIPHHTLWMLSLALVIAVAPLAWLTTFSPGFRIAPITAILVLLSSMGITMGPVDFAVERLLEIGLGCAVGLGVRARHMQHVNRRPRELAY